MKDFVSITQLARTLRRNQTPEENILWQVLRNRNLSGKKFLRQHPIVYEELNGKKYFFIADFYCAEQNLVLELDGKIHNYQKDYDQQRNLVLKGKGLKILRLNNEEFQNMGLVLKKIKDLMLDSPPLSLWLSKKSKVVMLNSCPSGRRAFQHLFFAKFRPRNPVIKQTGQARLRRAFD